MHYIIFLPGILGSSLVLNGEEVWPPSLGELLSGKYKRIDKLANPQALPHEVIKRVIVRRIYGPILDALDVIAKSIGATVVEFPYDWRNDLWQNRGGGHPAIAASERLANEIAKLVRGGASEISLVAHSMGGLVARLVLESNKYGGQPWFRRIQRFAALCTPHLGAPLSLGRALAVEPGELSLSSADIQRLVNDPNFPAGYQLFPVPGHATLFDASKVLDIYSASVAQKYGLAPSNQTAAATSWRQLNLQRRPRNVNYVFLNGSGFSTSNQYYYDDRRYVATATAEGDGTVPEWSTNPGGVEEYSFYGGHLDVTYGTQFQQQLHYVFGIPFMSTRARDSAGLMISIKRGSYAANEAMEVLLVPDVPSTRISGQLRLMVAEGVQGRSQDDYLLVPAGVDLPVVYEGAQITHMPITLMAPARPGAYVLTFTGTHATRDEAPAGFFVSSNSETERMRVQPALTRAARRGTRRSKKRAGHK
jgi:pimeloyl-ACP methyl ester carboxylesterase